MVNLNNETFYEKVSSLKDFRIYILGLLMLLLCLIAHQYYLANAVSLADAAIIDEIKSLHSSVYEVLETSKNIDERLDQSERKTTAAVDEANSEMYRRGAMTFTIIWGLCWYFVLNK